MKKYYVSEILIFLIGVSVGSILTYTIGDWDKTPEEAIEDSTKRYETAGNYQGIDVSHHQGHINWSLVAKDKHIQFVYIKATEGATHVDKSYRFNITEARRYGLKCGSYHYLRNTSRISSQFENFKTTAKRDIQDLIPIVDVEEKVAKDSIRLFCNLIRAHYGKRPVIYGTNRSYNSFCAPDFNNYILMIGRYGANRPVIKGTGHYDIWQYSQEGKVDGIEKPVDLNRFHPDFDLNRLLLEP